MPAYIVKILSPLGATLIGGNDTQIVFAASVAAARQIAAAKYSGEGDAWIDATVTEIAAASDWTGWTFAVTLCGGLGTEKTGTATFSYVATTGQSIDQIGTALAALCNEQSGIAHAAYDASGNVLTVAGAADGLGDQTIIATATPPDGSKAVASAIGTVTYGRAYGTALTVALPADAAVIPVSVLSAKAG